jgi:PTH2 family peptidyl-tRNA hydrolase
MNDPKQVIIIRKDLNMRKGKIAAQAAHASLKALIDISVLKYDNEKQETYWVIGGSNNSPLGKWLFGSYKKVCLYVNSEKELEELYKKAMLANLPCSLIIDNGLTEFNGVHTKTAVAIGPENSGKIDLITGHLPLL